MCLCVQVRLKQSGPQLFGGSEDEEDGDEKEDDSRFEIRPQFEGLAGQKVRRVHTGLQLYNKGYVHFFDAHSIIDCWKSLFCANKMFEVQLKPMRLQVSSTNQM